MVSEYLNNFRQYIYINLEKQICYPKKYLEISYKTEEEKKNILKTKQGLTTFKVQFGGKK
jgi:hypothetical protein